MGKVRIKNVSRGLFDLSLDFVKEGKIVSMKPDTTYILSEEEYDYLAEQCNGVFEDGFLQVIDMDDCKSEKIESENVMTNDQIEDLLSKTIGKFRTEVKKITSDNLLADIYHAAVDRSKDEKYTEAIEKQIKECGNESIVL